MKLIDIILGKRRVRDEYLNGGQGGFVSRWARPPTKNTAEWLGMFSRSPRLAVVDRIASDIANVPGHLLYVKDDGTETEITSHPFLDFIEKPNPLYEMTSSALWRLYEIYLMLVGESFLLIERDEHERPVELWSVPPHWVQMTPYLGHPYYDIVSPGGTTMSVLVDDMFVMKQLNPLDPFMRGLGIAESIADEVEIDEYAAKFQKRFFYNDATPPIVFSLNGGTPDQVDTFLARWNQKHRGVENSHRVGAFAGNVTVTELGSGDGKNLGFIESRIAMRDAVLEHFGVPREIMGITENSNRATADAAQYIYAKNVLMPRIQSREEAINAQLLPLFGDHLVWRFDAVVPYDKDFNKAKAIDGWNTGLLTKNEARALMDFPDVEGGNVFKISINDMFLNESDDPVEVTQAMLQEDTIAVETAGGSGKKAARRINISAMLRKETVAINRNEKQFEAAITQFFSNQQAQISKALGFETKADRQVIFALLANYLLNDGTFDPVLWAALAEDEQQRITEDIVTGLLDWTGEAKKLTQIFTPLWKRAYDDGVTISKDTYELLDIPRPEFVSAAKIHGGRRIAKIQQTTQNNIANIIADGVANGVSQVELARAIQSEMSTTKARAKLIARQETMTALATGQFDMMKAAGATTKTWHHRDQKDPRDGTNGKVNHVAMENERDIPINERFSNGLLYPRDPECNDPKEVINCRCYLTYGGF